MLSLAHVGHWTWVLYLPPAIVVLASAAYNAFSERREKRGASSEDPSR